MEEVTMGMKYLSEFVGSLIFLLGGYAYMCNISLKNTLASTLNYIELVFAWSLAVGFGLCVAVIMGGPALLNPGVVFGQLIVGGIEFKDAIIYLLMEFLAAGVAMIVCMIFFWDSFKTSGDAPKRGIFSAYPVLKNIPINFIQEVLATFVFLFLVFACLKATSGDSAALQIGVIGFSAVALLALSLNSTGFSMNAMRSFFSSIWFVILPFPNKGKEAPDWAYQFIVNLVGSSIGGILAVLAITAVF